MEPKFTKTTLDVQDVTIDTTFDYRMDVKRLKGDTDKTRAPSVSAVHLQALRKNLRAKKKLDPIIVWDEATDAGDSKGRLVLLDGRYRLAAYEAEGRKRIPARLFSGNRMEAQLVALCANSRDVQPLSSTERMNAAWRLVWQYGDDLPKPRIAEASGVSTRTILTMRNKRKAMIEAGATGGTDWRQDKHWPKENEWTAPEPEERAATVKAVAETIRQAVHDHRLGNRFEDLTEALEMALGHKRMLEIADWYVDPEFKAEAVDWMPQVDDLAGPNGEADRDPAEDFSAGPAGSAA